VNKEELDAVLEALGISSEEEVFVTVVMAPGLCEVTVIDANMDTLGVASSDNIGGPWEVVPPGA